MIKSKRKLLFLTFVVILSLLYASFTFAYKSNSENPVHQYITNESQFVWSQAPFEIKSHLATNLSQEPDKENYGTYRFEDIITGSGEEDYPITEAFEHFWEPDNPNYPSNSEYNDGLDVAVWCGSIYGNCRSSYKKALDYWNNKVLPLYTGVTSSGVANRIQQDEAYYWLGRTAHLLEDATVTEHIFLDYHVERWGL